MPTVSSTPAQEPVEGGSYLRNTDGSLTVTQQTVQPAGRRKAASPVPATPAAPIAPTTDTPKDKE